MSEISVIIKYHVMLGKGMVGYMDIFLIVLVIVEAIVIVLLSLFFGKRAAAYRKISMNAEKVAKGKLDVEDIQVSGNRKSDTGVLASGVDALKNNLLTFIEATKGNVITLSDAIDVLSGSVTANQAGNEQIADSVTTVAEKTAEQMNLVEQNMELINSSNAQIQEINEAVSLIKEKLEETVQVSQRGIKDIQGYSADMDEVTKDLSRIDQVLVKFNEQIKQIEAIGDIIIGINSQLTLLAFNASIEAARAGDAGKGFTVVADEMNHMSNDTRKGMESIHDIVKDILESTTQFNESIRKCEDTFALSKKTFVSVNDSLRSINDQSFEINGNIKDIVDKTGKIADNSKDLMVQADRLHGATQLITDKTHEIAAASQETVAESSQISENVDALNGMLGSIQGLLGQFQTSVLPTGKSSSKQIKIAFLSMLDNDFWFGVRKGVFYAQKELNGKNALVDYFSVKGDSDIPTAQQVEEKIDECIAEGYDGIVFAGFLAGAVAPLKRAIAKGIKVVAFNCDCSPEVKRLAVFSPDGVEAGELAGKCMQRALNKKGKVAILTGDLGVQVNRDRKAGFMKQMATCKGINIVEEFEELDIAEKIYQRTIKCLNQHADLNAIYATCGLQEMVAKAIEDSGKKNKVIVIGFDDNQEILSYISKGIIYATIKQDPFGQGHDPVIWLYNHLVTGEPFPKENMGCKLSVADRENVDNLLKA